MAQWHTMNDEPLEVGVILYSRKINRIFDATYIGDGQFQVAGYPFLLDASHFDRWYQRGDFIKDTGLRDSLKELENL